MPDKPLYIVLDCDDEAGTQFKMWDITTNKERAEKRAYNLRGLVIEVPLKIVSDFRGIEE